MPPLASASPAAISGVGRSERPASGTNAAFSSKRCTRAPVCSSNSAISCSLGGGGRGMSISPSPDGPGGNVRNVTLKNRARTGGNDTVFCLAWLLGMLTTLRKLRPSSLASRSGPGGGGPKGKTNPASASDTPRISCGCAKAIWIHAFSPTGALGNELDLTKSPSHNSDASTVPPLEVMVGFSEASGTSADGTRYATTALSL